MLCWGNAIYSIVCSRLEQTHRLSKVARPASPETRRRFLAFATVTAVAVGLAVFGPRALPYFGDDSPAANAADAGIAMTAAVTISNDGATSQAPAVIATLPPGAALTGQSDGWSCTQDDAAVPCEAEARIEPAALVVLEVFYAAERQSTDNAAFALASDASELRVAEAVVVASAPSEDESSGGSVGFVALVLALLVAAVVVGSRYRVTK